MVVNKRNGDMSLVLDEGSFLLVIAISSMPTSKVGGCCFVFFCLFRQNGSLAII